MAAAGLGADSPSPRSLPMLTDSPAFEEKNDYGADDEDGSESVDSSFDYIPSGKEFTTGEDNKSDEEKKEGDEEAQNVENIELGDVTDTSVVQQVAVERHTVIQDTTVVKRYVSEDAVDSSTQPEELIAVSVSTSSAVIDQQTSTLVSTKKATDIGDSSSEDTDMDLEIPAEIKFPSESEASDDTEGKARKTVEKMSPTNDEGLLGLDDAVGRESLPSDGIQLNEAAQQKAAVPSESSASLTASAAPPSTPASDSLAVDNAAERMEISTTIEKEQPADESENMEIDDEIVGETPQSAESEATGAAQRESPPQSPAPAKTSSSPTSVATKQAKSDLSLERDHSAPASIPDTTASPKPRRKRTVAPVHTPKQSKRTASKKRKVFPVSPKSSESDAKASLSLRRSSRVKTEPPKFAYPANQLSDVAAMTHFGRKADNRMTCKHCGKKFTSRGAATRHLQDCPVLTTRKEAAAQVVNEAPPSLPTHLQPMKPEISTSEANDGLELVQVMGSKGLANKVQGSFQEAAFSGHAPVSRFQKLITNDFTGLRHLNVQNLLDAFDTEDGPAVQLHLKLPGVRRSTGFDVLKPVSKAKARDLENCPLRFPAPRSVAEYFIAPLAKELGLEYAMARHTAKIVSCPQEKTVLDWQFHRPETVIFHLSGKAMWSTKKSRVEYPLDCFHPASWQLEDVAQIAKFHRVASMNQPTEDFLTPPDDNFDVFDENATVTGVSDEPQVHMLKSGSVLYLPGGVWFETETQGTNSLWLEVQLGSLNYEELVFSALKQLSWSDKQWCMGLQLYPGNRSQVKHARHHAEGCIKSLRKDMATLDGSDVLPEYLATEDMQDLVDQGLVQVTNKTRDSTSIAVDLTNPRFKLKHTKVFRDVSYRVNPVAILMSTEEIPYLQAQRSETQSSEASTPANTSQTQHRALKKTPKPKPKRKQTLRAISHTDKRMYVLDESFGNDKSLSQLHVKFQCSAEQATLVEWLRGRGTEVFDLEEFSRGEDSTVRHGKAPARSEESARSLLRFLYFVGYVTQL